MMKNVATPNKSAPLVQASLRYVFKHTTIPLLPTYLVDAKTTSILKWFEWIDGWVQHFQWFGYIYCGNLIVVSEYVIVFHGLGNILRHQKNQSFFTSFTRTSFNGKKILVLMKVFHLPVYSRVASLRLSISTASSIGSKVSTISLIIISSLLE